MSDGDRNSERFVGSLRIVLFEIAGVRLGIDVDQVARMMTPEQAVAEEVEALPFHEYASFGERTVEYRSPYVLTCKEDERMRGVLVEFPRDIVRVAESGVRGLPPLLAAADAGRIFWGAALIESDIVLLLDFYRLLRPTAWRAS